MNQVKTPFGEFSLHRRNAEWITVYKADHAIRLGGGLIAPGGYFIACHRNEAYARRAPERHYSGTRMGCFSTADGRPLNPLPADAAPEVVGEMSLENLHHFRCGAQRCHRWWSVGDAHLLAEGARPPLARVWFCPWCGTRQRVVPAKPIARTH